LVYLVWQQIGKTDWSEEVDIACFLADYVVWRSIVSFLGGVWGRVLAASDFCWIFVSI